MINPEVAIVPFSSIKLGERGREDYGNIPELAASILSNGIIQPLAVQRMEGKDENGKEYLLIAGGRRFTAISYHNDLASKEPGRAPITKVPVRIYPEDLPQKKFREIELEENLRRKDLEWHERARMQKALHMMKVEEHGEYVPTRTDLGQERKGWSVSDTAALVGTSRSTVQKDIELATLYEQNPEAFKKCKTAHDARKLVKKLKKEVVIDSLAREVEKKRESDKSSGLLSLADNYILGDFFKGVKNVPPGSINLVEIDPPYAIDLKGTKQRDSTDNQDLSKYNEIPASDYEDFLLKTFQESYRVMSQNSWLICWFAHEPWFETVYQLLLKAGFSAKRTVGMWIKPTAQCQHPDKYLANATEMFFYARKGEPQIITQGHLNYYTHNPVPHQKKTHPTERPLALMRELLTTFALPGARVLTPFAGSGKTIIAAYHEKMTCVGYDLSTSYRNAYLAGLARGEFR